MSLHAQPIPPVPEETARVARAACPVGKPSHRRRAAPVQLCRWGLRALLPTRGQLVAALWRLARITRFQFAEHLSARQAATVVRARLDWQDALALDLTSAGFDLSELNECRRSVLAGEAEHLLLDRLLAQCRERGRRKAGGRQRQGTRRGGHDHVLAAVRARTWLELCRRRCGTHLSLWPGWPPSGGERRRSGSGSSGTTVETTSIACPQTMQPGKL